MPFWTSRSSCSSRGASWIWSRAFRPSLQATKFDTVHLVLVVAFFRYKLFTESRFCCVVHKLPSIFLVHWHTKLQLFLQWLRLKHLILCGSFVTRLGPLPGPCPNETARGISWSALGYLPKVRARSNPWHTSLGEQLVLLVQNRTIEQEQLHLFELALS